MKSTKNNNGLDPKEKSLINKDEKSLTEKDIVIPDDKYFTFDDDVVYIDERTHQLCAKDNQGVPYIVSDELHISRVYKNLDTQTVRITLTHITKWTTSEIEVKLQEIKSSTLFGVLAKKGVMVCEQCTGALCYYILNQVNSYVSKYGFRYEHYRIRLG